MKKALVTGANGFLGSALVRELVKNNVEVIALDRDGCNNNIPENVRFVAHELSESSKLADVIMVLDHGHITEKGSHEKLIAQKGQYYRLYTGAFELE